MQDVKCKEQTGLVQRLADLEASYQAVYIRAHEAELTELRRQIDVTVARASGDRRARRVTRRVRRRDRSDASRPQGDPCPVTDL